MNATVYGIISDCMDTHNIVVRLILILEPWVETEPSLVVVSIQRAIQIDHIFCSQGLSRTLDNKS